MMSQIGAHLELTIGPVVGSSRIRSNSLTVNKRSPVKAKPFTELEATDGIRSGNLSLDENFALVVDVGGLDGRPVPCVDPEDDSWGVPLGCGVIGDLRVGGPRRVLAARVAAIVLSGCRVAASRRGCTF